MTWLGGRKLTRLACVLVMAGCTNEATVSGKVPERATREPRHSDSKTASKERTALYNKRRQSDGTSAEPKVETLDPADARIGVASTHEFHQAGCSRLKDVPVADQVRFTSKWDGLDAGYRPCDECKAAR